MVSGFGKYDDYEDRVRTRATRRGSRPRTKDRPRHADAIPGRVVGVDRGRYRTLVEDRTVIDLTDRASQLRQHVPGRATVSVVDEDTEEEARYQIVGEHEADVKQGKISIVSPLARAMIGMETGDVVEVNTPGGGKAYEILKVEWL